ncbi:MAG: T9SS type A sorting domain-containing protein [Lewinellaceae bacterium]|nr:T9SS type A sorting domain-containing protein [Lewinellaceae bacterium]
MGQIEEQCSNLNSGVYFFTIVTENGPVVKKVVKI